MERCCYDVELLIGKLLEKNSFKEKVVLHLYYFRYCVAFDNHVLLRNEREK